jgi:hypothetical protein
MPIVVDVDLDSLSPPLSTNRPVSVFSLERSGLP